MNGKLILATIPLMILATIAARHYDTAIYSIGVFPLLQTVILISAFYLGKRYWNT